MDNTLRNVVRYLTYRDGGDVLSPPLPPNTVEDIFKDFTCRRSALLKALTTDANSLYSLCDPEIVNLSLWGYADGTWKVYYPRDALPPDVPQPVIGINFAADGMRRHDWLSLVAAHSDSWLISVAYFFLGAARLGSEERSRLFSQINDLPTLFEIVSGQKK